MCSGLDVVRVARDEGIIAVHRTEAEYRVLLKAVGFRLERVMPTQTALSIIEGIPA
jgi:hypothetical protein